MSKVFPKLEELYICITNDCYLLFLEKNVNQENFSIKDLFQKRKNKKDIIAILDLIKSNILANKSKNERYSDITSFSWDYINKISEFFSENKINNIDVRYVNDFCLAYITLEGIRNIFFNLEESEIFLFRAEKYLYFSKFLAKYHILTDIKNFYEKYSNEIKTIYNNDKKIYINLIIRFDSDFQFCQKYFKNSVNSEQNNGINIQKNYGKKANNLINNEKENNNNKNKKIKKNIDNINFNKDDEENKKDILILNNLDKYSNIEEPAKKQNEKNEIKINIIDIKEKDYKNNNKINKYEFEEISINDFRIKNDFEILNLKFERLEDHENFLHNSSYLKLGKMKNEYLGSYIQLLKKAINNLSNPYNFNFWRKLSNIILKNIFIILKKNNFAIVQNKNISILDGIESIANEMKTKYNIKEDTFKKIESEKNNIKEGNQNENSSPYSDKNRKFNLITIAKNGKVHILGSLAINFLFYLKEKGNQIDKSDETILNLNLFNNLNTTEEDLKEYEKIKLDEKDINIVANGKEINDGKINQEIKTYVNIKGKEGKLRDNASKNEMDKDDEVIKEEVKDKADEGPNNENFSYKSNEIKYNRINLNEKYEGKKSFTGIELVQLLKNPFKFQKRIIRNNNFDSIYKKVDKIQKELGIMDDKNKISKLENDYKNLLLKIKDLKKIIEFEIKKKYDNIELNIQNIQQIIKSNDLDSNLKEKLEIYLQLQDLDNKITPKKNFYKKKNKEFIELDELIIKKENEVNDYRKKMKERIEKIAELINLYNIFDEYKTELKDKILNKPEYKEYPDIFNNKNIDSFKINNFLGFLETHLKDHSFSIIKGDITNYNLFIEILNSFPELRHKYAKNIDVNF